MPKPPEDKARLAIRRLLEAVVRAEDAAQQLTKAREALAREASRPNLKAIGLSNETTDSGRKDQ
jgi:hypothetical protein